MKLLLVPDVHGRDFWIEPCKDIDKYDKVIFLGDYHDPYPFEVSKDTSRRRLRKMLVPFVEENREKIICLEGNHDGYIRDELTCRGDRYCYREIKYLLRKLDLQLAYKVDNFLFTHAGVLPQWLEINNLTLDNVLNGNVPKEALYQVSKYREGFDEIGSCVWADVNEYICSKKITGIYQIFGHTMQYPEYKPIITNEFACIDTRHCYELDTEIGYESLSFID